MKPAKPITDPTFRYTSSAKTDIRKTFARIRREQKAEADAKAAAELEAANNVRQIKRKGQA